MLKRFLLIAAIVSPALNVNAQTLSEFRCDLFPGQWQMETKKGLLIEEWKTVDRFICKGKSYAVENGDTAILETMELKIMDGSLAYAPTVSNQNNGKEILFFLNPEKSELSKARFVFENINHDFPQRIIYDWSDRETLVARIEGMVNGKLEYSDYYYKRIIR